MTKTQEAYRVCREGSNKLHDAFAAVSCAIDGAPAAKCARTLRAFSSSAEPRNENREPRR